MTKVHVQTADTAQDIVHDVAAPALSPAAAVARRGWKRVRPLLCALVAPAQSSPCPHQSDGTMCEECAWHWAIR